MEMTLRAAWFCPSCQRYHAPHCDTCPAPAQIGTGPLYPAPWLQPSTPLPPQPWTITTYCTAIAPLPGWEN